jgi:beta-glucosidase
MEPTDADLRARVDRLTLEQKVRLVTGADTWSLHAEPAVGLRRLVVSDGPAGVRGEHWDEREPSANVPSPTALAATWDESVVERIGALLAAESRRKSVDVLLAPTVNLHRTPYGGRHFECFSEDPLLTARIGGAYVRGVQSGGVGATVKHFVANDSETDRRTLDARIDARVLQELYLAPFEDIVRDARAWAVMAAYNAVNGTTMTESPLLRDVLHEQWGFDGVTMSDWFATRSTVESARAGLDLAMPGPASPWTDGALVAAVRSGDVDEALLDDKVLRILRLAARVGALDGVAPATGTRTAAPWSADEVSRELRRAAAAGCVLVRNDAGALPLDRAALRRVAVLGPNAAVARTLGGGSATVFPPYTVAPLDGIRHALGDGVEVVTSPGVRAHTRAPVARAPMIRLPDGSGDGVEIRFLAADGTVLGTEARTGAAFTWMGGFGGDVPADEVAVVEARTTLRAGRGRGRTPVGTSGVGPLPHARQRRPGDRRDRGATARRGRRRGAGGSPAGAARGPARAGEEVEVVWPTTWRAAGRDRHAVPAQRRGAVRVRRRRDRAARGARRRRRRGGARRRHDRGGRDRGPRPRLARAARPPGRARASCRGREPPTVVVVNSGAPGAAALGRRRRRGAGRVVPRTGGGQRAGRRAAR